MEEVEKVIEHLTAAGYRHARLMPDGSLCAVMPLLFTAGLFYGLDEWCYKRRYCYETLSLAVDALNAWDGRGDPPGPWIKEKSRFSERLGPGATT